MATTSEINIKLSEVSASINTARTLFNRAKSNIVTAEGNLGKISTAYTDLITTIQAFGDTDYYEQTKKAELAKLITEFTGLRAEINVVIGNL